MNTQNGGGPAFPVVEKYCIGHKDNGEPIFTEYTIHGMTLHDYFVAKAMIAGTADGSTITTPAKYAAWCYEIADAMLAERASRVANGYSAIHQQRDELLAALETMVELSGSPDFNGAPSDAAVIAARAAIAKVKGGAV